MPQSMINLITVDSEFNSPSLLTLHDDLYKSNHVEVSMLRLDEIHPVISGNKLFKLYYFLEEAKRSSNKTIITFGGAYSNHLAATAFACKRNQIKSIAFVRGEKPAVPSPTLLFCDQQQMQLNFLSRSSYKDIHKEDFLAQLKKDYGEFILVPEGGFSVWGAKGAALIPRFFNSPMYTHVCVAVGTATTLAGIINGSGNNYQTLGFSVLKNLHDINDRLKTLRAISTAKYSINGEYHFGGYAKKTDDLIGFINTFYDQHHIPLDFVYTGKMMFGVNDLIRKKYFPPQSRILCIHTGGLQGNQSLPESMLHFS